MKKEEKSSYLVRLRSRLATTLFMPSNGFSFFPFETPPSLAESALSGLTRLSGVSPAPNVLLPVLPEGRASKILLTISTRA